MRTGPSLLVAAILLSAFAALRAADNAAAPLAAAPAEAAPDIPSPSTVIRTYDVRELLVYLPNFADTPDLSTHLQAARFSGGGGGGGLFPARQPTVGVVKTREELVEQLKKLITQTVDSGSWHENGGMVGEINERHGLLVINQTAEAHKQIQQLLDEQRQRLARPVRIRAHWVGMQRRDLEALLKPAAWAAAGRAALLAADTAALERLPESVPHYRAEVVCLDDQRVGMYATRNTPVLGDEAAVFATGLTLDVQALVSADAKTALVTLQSQVGDVDVGRAGGAARAAPSTRPATQPTAGGLAPATFLQNLATSARVPLGQTVLIGGMTPGPTIGLPDPPQLYLLLEVSAE